MNGMELAELFLGMCAGSAAAAGVFALITVIGILPRWAGKTRTAGYVHLYEWMVIAGGTLANVGYLLKPQLLLGRAAEGVIGLSMGIFAGGLIMSLAEVLDVFPILFRRARLQCGLPLVILTMAIGKMAGAFYFFLSEID